MANALLEIYRKTPRGQKGIISHNGINGICYEKSNKQNLAPSIMLQRENMVIKDKRRQYHKSKKRAI